MKPDNGLRLLAKELGLLVEIDAIANLWLTREGKEGLPPIAIGSHDDTVRKGGMFDGALGVTEILMTLDEYGLKNRHPLKLVTFTGEQPNPFNVSTLGSKVLSGRLTKQALLTLYHETDESALQQSGLKTEGDVEQVGHARIQPGDLAVLLELHIEQGRRLKAPGLKLSAVSEIICIYRENVVVEGTQIIWVLPWRAIGATLFCRRANSHWNLNKQS